MLEVASLPPSIIMAGFRPMTSVQIEADVFTLPLFSWAQTIRRKRGAGMAPKHCRDCGCKINRGSRGRCKACATVGQLRARPADFLETLRKLGSQGAARHYHASFSTVTRWRRELELKPQARMKRGIGQSRPDRGFTPRPVLNNRDMSLVGQAVDYLRRFGSVYRCDASGKAVTKGTHWRRNFAVMTDDDVIQRAERLGWVKVEM